ncbi:polysaccharide biosynthesis protein [Arenibaculum pallidiluteum]|uniref:polysaccharide biosynthesis protein n=1 Tax=Arenibaculum pallidiluteum TaxID=2812559 RepID=UPI001A97498E|nr:polysaccharide biosynthesis protein [Arenibaculum pallidiluteum]
MAFLDNKRVLVTGGTGSLGKVLLKRLLGGSAGRPARITIFSRDEAKQHALRTRYARQAVATDDIVYRNFDDIVRFRIGDVRDFASVAAAVRDADVIFNAAALKQVPTCEYFPHEAVLTNVGGPHNIVRAIRELDAPVQVVVGISTDKAVEPVNVMGMTKAIQERVFAGANLDCPDTRFVLVRYGNVLASRGSVIPLFHEQIRKGGPVTITDPGMTRFLLTLEDAVDTVLAAVEHGARGETFIPRVPGALITDVARVLVGDRPVATKVVGIRPGEKLHEVLVSQEEAARTRARHGYYVIGPLLPDLRSAADAAEPGIGRFCSSDDLLDLAGVRDLLARNRLLIGDVAEDEDELLR